jgi:ABC-2 type transport system permease protein
MQTPGFSVALFVEFAKLRRSLALVLVVVSPALIAAFLFASVLRSARGLPWEMMLQTSAAIWAFFMLPMSVTALTALVAQTEHGPRAWDTLRALPLPRWHLYAAKAVGVLALVLLMSALLAILSTAAIAAAAWLKPVAAPTGAIDFVEYLGLLGRIFVAGWLLVAVQLWIALRYSSFVPALAVGIGGTFFAVVASSAKIGVVLPWQIPINQLASDPDRALLALSIGALGGCVALVAMLRHLSRREVV